MDHTWGDAEILLAVHPDHGGQGDGTYILDRLEREAERQGLNYLWNVVRPSHPDVPGIQAWLRRRGFRPSEDGSLRRQVGHGGKPSRNA
jgi:N-acetylglutamate synthase-like GNAT family acetyltransferase